MSKKSGSSDGVAEQINEAVEDGGGCAETWEALSEMRGGDTEQSRRGFITRVGVTLGALPLGATTVGAGRSSSKREKEEVDASAEEVHGRKRGQLLRAANTSEQVKFVAEQMDRRPGVESVFEYSVEGDVGYGVTFGKHDDEGPVIRYYESDSLNDSGVKAFGSMPVGDGARAIDGEFRTVTDIHTPESRRTTREIQTNARYDDLELGSGSYTLNEEEAIVVRDLESPDEQFDVFVPVVDEDDEIINRVIASGSHTTGSLSVQNLPTEVDDGVGDIGIQNHIVCGPFGTVCTDYCAVLCTAIGTAAGSGCYAACYGSIVGIPLSPVCGAICAGGVGATCYATCKRNAH